MKPAPSQSTRVLAAEIMAALVPPAETDMRKRAALVAKEHNCPPEVVEAILALPLSGDATT